MNVWAAVVGTVAVVGLLCAWRLRAFASAFLLLGIPATAVAALFGLAGDVVSGALVVLLGVPYWVLFLVLYALGTLESGVRRPSEADG